MRSQKKKIYIYGIWLTLSDPSSFFRKCLGDSLGNAGRAWTSRLGGIDRQGRKLLPIKDGTRVDLVSPIGSSTFSFNPKNFLTLSLSLSLTRLSVFYRYSVINTREGLRGKMGIGHVLNFEHKLIKQWRTRDEEIYDDDSYETRLQFDLRIILKILTCQK